MIFLAINLRMFGHGSTEQLLMWIGLSRCGSGFDTILDCELLIQNQLAMSREAHILYILLKIIFNFQCETLLSLIHPLEMMTLLTINLSMFRHGSADKLLVRSMWI